MINYFKAYLAPDAEAEEGTEPVVTPRDFKALSELKNTTKLNGGQTTYEDIIFNFLEQVFDLN